MTSADVGKAPCKGDISVAASGGMKACEVQLAAAAL